MINKTEPPVKVAISHGDINGIGYEVIIKTLIDNRILELCTPVVYGSPKIAAYHRKTINIGNFSFNNVRTPDEVNIKRPNLVNCIDDNTRVELGKSTQMAGEASLISLEKAVDDLKEGKLNILVTAPINKNNMQSVGFNFPGHTEYLIQNFGTDNSGMMIMVSDNLRIGVVTGHISIADVAQTLTASLLERKIRIFYKSLLEDFAITKPKIAILGLNPHAGDGGVIGNEENTLMMPVLDKLRTEGIIALGPYPADGFFGSGQYRQFDGILAMYHDQGLIPFKTLAFDEGVNFTAGLSIVRTSPGHGTAYEIAGSNQASENSFRNALYLACDVHKNRKNYREAAKNPLKRAILDPGSVVDEVPPVEEENDAM